MVIENANIDNVFTMLGVEPNEKFLVKFNNPINVDKPIPKHEYYVDQNLVVHRDDGFKPNLTKKGKIYRPSLYLGQLLNGSVEIIRSNLKEYFKE